MRRLLALTFALALSPAVASGQESAAPMIHGAEVRVSAKKWEDAEQFLREEAIPAFPENAELWFWLGYVYAQGSNRNTEEAAKAFAKAHELADPEDTVLKEKVDKAVQAIWGPLVNTAAKAVEKGELEQAEMLLKQAVEINPEGAEAWINLGTVYLRQKKHAEATVAYEKAVALQPENTTLTYNLGVTYHELGRAAKAAGDTAKAAEYLTKAETTYKAHLAKKPGDVDVVNNLAALYQDRGDEAKMRETLGQVAAADSASQEDFYNAGRAFLRGKDYPKAEQAFAKTIALTDESDPASVEMRAFAMEYQGLVLIQQKKYDPAIEVLQKLIALEPDNATAYEYLGFAYRDTGRKEEAAAAFMKSEELKKAPGGGEKEGEEAPEAEEAAS
jgi:Flp pilus assembly protein TadD